MTTVKPFRERLEWRAEPGEIVDGPVRYLLIRPDTLMGLFARLSPKGRRAALATLAASTREFGRRSAARYQTMGAGDAERLFRAIETTAPQLGWGRWTIEPTKEGVALTVRNSPFAAGIGRSDGPVCAAIAGMLGAVASLATGREMTGVETACAAHDAGEVCRFAARDLPFVRKKIDRSSKKRDLGRRSIPSPTDRKGEGGPGRAGQGRKKP